MSEQAEDAEAERRKYRRDIIACTGIFLFSLSCLIIFVLSVAGYVPSIPVDPEHPYYLSPFTWCISSILLAVASLYMIARARKRLKDK